MCPVPAGAGKMEAVIEKECSALGGLFQTIISDMKVGRRPPCADLAAELRLRPGSPAQSLSERWPVATCGSAAARVSPAHPGRRFGLCWVTGRAVSTEVSDALCPLPVHCPRGRPHLVFLEGSGPRLQVFHCLSLDGVSCDLRRLDAWADT